MNRLLAATVILMMAGCDTSPYDPEVIRRNRATLNSPGEPIGTLPDGREVVRYQIERGSQHPHILYVVTGSITSNRLQRNGKATSPRVEAFIDDIDHP